MEIEQIQEIIVNNPKIKQYEPLVREILKKRIREEITEEQMYEELKEMNLDDDFWLMMLFRIFSGNKKE